MAKDASEIKRVGKFGLVGVINTLIDFIVYNTELKYLAIGKELAKAISATLAMIFSFFANKSAVFQDKQKAVGLQAVKFFAITAVNIYIIQLAVIYVVKKSFLIPLADSTAKLLHLAAIFTPDFMSKNVPFFSAILIGLVWNYLMYKKVVFKK